MKILNIVLLALVVTLTGDAFAQRGATQETTTVKEQAGKTPTRGQVEISEEAELQAATSADRAKEMAEAKAREVDAKVGGLTSDQRTKIYSIYEGTYNSIREYKEANPEMSGADLRTEGRSMLKEGHQKAFNVLTAEQQEKMGRGKKANADNMDKAMQRAKHQTDELDKVVGLSDDQKKQVLDMNADMWEEMKAWKEANPSASGEEKRAYAKEMNKKRMEGYKTVLNEEQVEKFLEHRNGGH